MKKSELIKIIKEEVNVVLEQTGNPYGDDLMYQYQQNQRYQALKNRTAIGKGGAKIPFSSLSKGEKIAYDILTDPKPSMMYDNPIIGGNVQPELRLAHNSFPTNKLTEPVKIKFIADKAGVLKAADSLELKKDMPYPKGSAIMDNGKGKLWAIPPEDFKKTYTIDPGGKSATPIPVKRRAVQMSKPFMVKPSWSDVPLHGKAGDFLVQYGPGDYGAVDAGEFKKTYNTKAMPKSKPTSAKTKADPKAKTVSKQQLASEIEKAAKGKKVTKKAIMATLRPFAKVLGIASIGFVANAIVKKATNKDWGGVAEEILMASPAGIPIMVATGFFSALKNNMNKYGLEAAQDVARVKTNILDRL